MDLFEELKNNKRILIKNYFLTTFSSSSSSSYILFIYLQSTIPDCFTLCTYCFCVQLSRAAFHFKQRRGRRERAVARYLRNYTFTQYRISQHITCIRIARLNGISYISFDVYIFGDGERGDSGRVKDGWTICVVQTDGDRG